MKRTIKIGTRASALALWQANHVRDQLLSFYPDLQIEIIKIKTTGDIRLDVQLAKIGGKGLFVKEIETALINGEIDLAVHSMKDMPAFLPDELAIGAFLKREDPRDALLSKGQTLAQLPPQAKVGTSSLRRICQLKKIRPDLQFVDLRGNVDTRLRKLKEGQFDAIILAAAGLKRLGMAENITEYLEIIPSVAQGAIGLELRKNDEKVQELIDPLNDALTQTCVKAERVFLEVMNASCQVPLGCYVWSEGGSLNIKSFLSSIDTEQFIFKSAQTSQEKSQTTAQEMAQSILNEGGRAILDEILSLS